MDVLGVNDWMLMTHKMSYNGSMEKNVGLVVFSFPLGPGLIAGSKWGFAAMTTEWLAARLLNVDRRWTLLYFGPGRNEKNQDVYVLRRT